MQWTGRGTPAWQGKAMNQEVERLDARGAVKILLFFNPPDAYLGLLGEK